MKATKVLITAALLIFILFVGTMVFSAMFNKTNDQDIDAEKQPSQSIEIKEIAEVGEYHFNFGQAEQYNSDMHEVGKDIPAGEYILIAENQESGQGFFEVYHSNETTIENCLSNKFFDTFIYIYLVEGTFILMDNCMAVPSSQIDLSKMVDDNYLEGMYKVGVDIPAGTYIISPNYSTSASIVNYAILAGCSWEDDDIIEENIAIEDKEITLKESQYIYIENGYIKGN